MPGAPVTSARTLPSSRLTRNFDQFLFMLNGSAASQTSLHALHVEINYRSDVEREQLRHQQSAHYGETEWLPRIAAFTKAERDGQGAEQRRRSGHHDWPESKLAAFVNRLPRTLPLHALRFERKVDHHDRVLLHDAEQHDEADESV